MLPGNTGALPPYSRDSPYWHRVYAADARGRAVAYRDAPGHTVAPSGLHQECTYTVANRSITGTDRDHVFPQNRVWSVAMPGMYEGTRMPSRFVPVRSGPPATNCRNAPELTPWQLYMNFILSFLTKLFPSIWCAIFTRYLAYLLFYNTIYKFFIATKVAHLKWRRSDTKQQHTSHLFDLLCHFQ